MKDFTFYLDATSEIGFVEEASHALVSVSGLPKARLGEIVLFESGEFGQVLTLKHETVEVLTFAKKQVVVGTRATRTNELLQIPVSIDLLGHTIDPLGNRIDNSVYKPTIFRPIESKALGIAARKRISKPLATGVSLVDLVIPLGRGQRQLILGDRKTGKTKFLLQILLTQAREGNIAIYAAIGKRQLDIKNIEAFLAAHNIANNTIIVASQAHDPAGIIMLTPFSAMTLAEYFRDAGRDVLVILDDLTTHAKFYREIALLAKRFPGRNSYPADIFSVHARLLERAGNFKMKNGESAISCLPVVETTQGDLTGYLQTNVMSMTDGHIFFDSDLFSKGRRPAINPFLSVTRVGRQTQAKLKRDMQREITVALALFEKTERFTHFGAELSEGVKLSLSLGENIVSFFDQTPETVIAPNVQVVLFSMLWHGVWQQKGASKMRADMEKIIALYESDRQIASLIDGRIAEAPSFNDFLGKIDDLARQLLERI